MHQGETNLDPGRPAVVLNVDDNPASLYAKSRTLRRAGFQVLEATNGEDALLMVDREAPSLVLLDVQLPDMSGLEVCRRIKAAPATYLLPVLHISATYKSDLIKEESQDSGADIYLVEPVSGEELITVVRTLLRLRRSELGLAESETRLRLATEGAQIATWDLDLRTGEAVWSSGLYELLGYPVDIRKATWEMWRSRIHPDDIAAVDAALDEAKAGRELFQCEHRVLPADGSAERWLAPRGRIYPDPQGNNTRVLGVATDVTARKHLEQERERLFALEQAARADAEHAARLKDQFLATLSHELRNPMSAVLGWLHLLRGGRLSAPQAEQALETIERNARLQNQLINDILDVSRIITGQFRLELAPLPVIPVLHDAIETVKPAAVAKSIAIDAELGAVDSWVQGDAGRLQQVFINLLGNAIKFSASHTRIRITSTQRDDVIVVAITDQGEGITAEVLPHIFERFRQADGSITRSHGGLGLGLAIARHYVDLHGGAISADSLGRGQGATFTVTLPLCAASEVVEPKDVAPATAIVGAGGPLAGIRTLVVDDDTGVVAMLAEMLRLDGALVWTAHDFEGAMAAHHSHGPFDALLSDIGLPGRDGYQLIEALRKDASEHYRRLVALAISGYARMEDRDRALEAGFDLYFAKPFDVKQLSTALAGLLGS